MRTPQIFYLRSLDFYTDYYFKIKFSVLFIGSCVHWLVNYEFMVTAISTMVWVLVSLIWPTCRRQRRSVRRVSMQQINRCSLYIGNAWHDSLATGWQKILVWSAVISYMNHSGKEYGTPFMWCIVLFSFIRTLQQIRASRFVMRLHVD